LIDQRDPAVSSGARRIRRQPKPQSVDDYREQFNGHVGKAKAQVYKELGTVEPDTPAFSLPKLEPNLDELTDHDLMELFVKLTRWADYFQNQLAVEEISEKYADAKVKRLEGLFMIVNKPTRASEAVTWVRAQMEADPEIQTAREALRVVYARRKLKTMLFEQAERDASVVSRELTRRTDTSNINRRADYRSP
jgi:hypothetical protein